MANLKIWDPKIHVKQLHINSFILHRYTDDSYITSRKKASVLYGNHKTLAFSCLICGLKYDTNTIGSQKFQ